MTDFRLGTQGFYGITYSGIVSKNRGYVFESILLMMLGITFFCLSKIFLICAIMSCVLSYPSENWLSELEILHNLFRKDNFYFLDTDCKSQHQSSIKALKALLQDQELYFHVSRNILKCWKKTQGYNWNQQKVLGIFSRHHTFIKYIFSGVIW